MSLLMIFAVLESDWFDFWHGDSDEFANEGFVFLLEDKNSVLNLEFKWNNSRAILWARFNTYYSVIFQYRNRKTWEL